LANVSKKINIAIIIALVIVIALSIFLLPQEVYADPYAIGDKGPAGGYIFYVSDSYCLEANPISTGGRIYSNVNNLIGTTSTDTGTGQANTNAIINQVGHENSIAEWCDEYDLTYNGVLYDDWFSPSKDELDLFYKNIYLQNIGEYIEGWYGSSSEVDADEYWILSFRTGTWWPNSKSTGGIILPVRAFSPADEVPAEEPDTSATEALELWVRDAEMTCYQVWINEDNNFEFVFWWEYKNNNWVKIYDMAGNEVFSIDMEKGKARFEADLPDGFYTVKTFHDGFETPIQEFIIGKP